MLLVKGCAQKDNAREMGLSQWCWGPSRRRGLQRAGLANSPDWRSQQSLGLTVTVESQTREGLLATVLNSEIWSRAHARGGGDREVAQNLALARRPPGALEPPRLELGRQQYLYLFRRFISCCSPAWLGSHTSHNKSPPNYQLKKNTSRSLP